jgi:hypothetical protein
MIEQTVKSYLLREYDKVKVFRFWDHNLTINKIVAKLPGTIRVFAARSIYAILSLVNFTGNMMVAVVTKKLS